MPKYTQEEIDRTLALTEDYAAVGMDRRGPGFDWESFLDRIERASDIDLGSDMDSPFIKKIKATAKKAWREANL